MSRIMRLNRKGVTRLVIELDKVVIKIPNFTCQWDHFLRGLLANMNEDKTWKFNQFPGSYAYGRTHLLCPVKWASWGGWIIVMQKVDRMLTFDEHDKYDCSEHLAWFPGDDKVVNYGLIDGKVVKVDYGEIDVVASEMNKSYHERQKAHTQP